MAVTAIVALIYTHLQIAESRRAPAGGQRQRTVARNSEAWLCIDKRLLIATKRVHQLGSYFLRERIRTRRPLSGLQLSSFRRSFRSRRQRTLMKPFKGCWSGWMRGIRPRGLLEAKP